MSHDDDARGRPALGPQAARATPSIHRAAKGARTHELQDGRAASRLHLAAADVHQADLGRADHPDAPCRRPPRHVAPARASAPPPPSLGPARTSPAGALWRRRDRWEGGGEGGGARVSHPVSPERSDAGVGPFLLGGTDGLFAQKTLEITDGVFSSYKNQGGYYMLGRTRDQIRTTEQVKAAMTTCQALKLDALVIIGGVTSNTDAAQLAETFAESKCSTKVVGVPVTLNGDLKNQFVETTVGFDTICKVNSQLISNVCTDALSAEKYYYFIRLMGRKASHVALECALQSHPNMVLLGEEVAASKLTISDITKQICDAVQARAEKDKYHGVVLIPEGLVESIPELYALLQEIHGLHDKGVSIENISSHLSPWASALFDFLPPFIRKQLLLHPESDDSAQLSQIETEKLLAQLVETEINKRLEEGTYKGKKFNAICHFFGYQARGALPSNFDCDYAYVLGHVCYHILAAGLNGYMATVTNLKSPVDQWKCGAAPITSMMTVTGWSRGPAASQIGKPAVHMASVDLKGKAYELLRKNSSSLLMEDIYKNPGPLQFQGPGADAKPISLCVEDRDYMGRIKQLQEYLEKVKSIVKPGCSQDVLKAALSSMAHVTELLTIMSSPSYSGQPTI